MVAERIERTRGANGSRSALPDGSRARLDTPCCRGAEPIDRGVRIDPVGAETMRARYLRRSAACGQAIARRRRRVRWSIHRLFSFIRFNWRGRPLTSYQVIIDLTSQTTTSSGLEVYARRDSSSTPKSGSPKNKSPPSTSPEATGTLSGTTASLPPTTPRKRNPQLLIREP